MASASPAPRPLPPVVGDGFRAVVTFDLDDEAPWQRWAALLAEGAATPFQTLAVTRPLLCRLTPALGARPFLVEVHDGATHVLSAALCLRSGPIRRIEFADFGLIDLAAPVFRTDLDLAGGRAAALRDALLAALPPHDVLLLAKMPAVVAGRPNPFALWPGVAPMVVFTMVHDPATGRPVAELPAVKESGRKRRKLTREGGAIRRVGDPARARDLLEFAFAQRAGKARRDGRRESLEEPAVRDFYREVVARGLADGAARLWEVTLGERIVAMVLGLAHTGRFNGTLMATLEDEGLNVYSPGMIAVASVLEDHVAGGGGPFDLGPGEHPYKLRFGGVPSALSEHVRARTPIGLLTVADRALRRLGRAHLRRNPALRTRLYRLLGRA